MYFEGFPNRSAAEQACEETGSGMGAHSSVLGFVPHWHLSM